MAQTTVRQSYVTNLFVQKFGARLPPKINKKNKIIHKDQITNTLKLKNSKQICPLLKKYISFINARVSPRF